MLFFLQENGSLLGKTSDISTALEKLKHEEVGFASCMYVLFSLLVSICPFHLTSWSYGESSILVKG